MLNRIQAGRRGFIDIILVRVS